MLQKIPDNEELRTLVGAPLYELWLKLCEAIDEKYDMECVWNSGGKAWVYEYKYRRGGKTLCALYAREKDLGFMVILGKGEREKFETRRMEFSEEVQKIYNEATIYRDGKWIMFMPQDASMFKDFMQLLEIKRRPKRNYLN